MNQNAKVAKYTVAIVSTDLDKMPPHVAHILASAKECHMIPWYTSDMTELAFIAKHRILPGTTLLVLDGGKTLARVVGAFPTAEELNHIFESI